MSVYHYTDNNIV